MSDTPNTSVREYVSIDEAVEELRISKDTWEEYIYPALLTGAIASFKIGRRRIISWQSLIAYLTHHHNGAIQGGQL